ncbi:hypothetical protein BGW36DRAFT_433688 [Talaromyces proteolyticus]|uniref:Uncharacterized protein n=1 Tax=Talaromyces proteolyticus TaxID=1131652 RepID=A0AAD4PUR6_9EURO|nr:uncharacterized protein BGW36DRAFT_433688 [Talaromyces proteolyticus]KAH8689687.1 hypothetical protein BGW36DRAFT_433688 [Talaromyces proteolyticus]
MSSLQEKARVISRFGVWNKSEETFIGLQLDAESTEFVIYKVRHLQSSILRIQTLQSKSSSTPQGSLRGQGDESEDTQANVASISSSTIHSNNDDGLAALDALQNTRTHSYQQYPVKKTRPPLSVRHSLSDESSYVNSRYKAIKDSLQDYSSRIFSMPSFNLPDFRSECHPGRFLGDYQRKDSVPAGDARINGAAEGSDEL